LDEDELVWLEEEAPFEDEELATEEEAALEAGVPPPQALNESAKPNKRSEMVDFFIRLPPKPLTK